MKTIIAIPADDSPRNANFNAMLQNSLKKFHPDVETRLFPNTSGDADYWYRAKPIIACELFEEGYEHIILMDNDQIILSSLEDILNDTDKYDVGVVLNDPTYPIGVWDITHPRYYNNGLVVVKSKEFAEHWKRLCFTEHFPKYQFREQDILNILCSDYMNYKVKALENMKVYGEFGKPNWINSYLKDGKVFFPFNGHEVELCVVHFGGGNTPEKGKYHLKFKPEVADYITSLIK